MMQSLCRIVLFAFLCVMAAVGCGSSHQVTPNGSVFTGYPDGRVSVIGTSDANGTPIQGSAVVASDQCVVVGAQCIAASSFGCASTTAPIDVVVSSAQSAKVICYGDTAASTMTVTSTSGSIEIPQNNNNAVVTFDPSTNGQPIKGNVTLDGNNVTLYGNGPDATIIEGNLVVDGNNAHIRGITVLGNVTLNKNNLSLILVNVKGNLTVNFNNTTVAGCEVFGNLESNSNDNVFVDNGVAGNFVVTGNNPVCTGNYTINDANANQVLDAGERTAALTCTAAR